MQILPESDYSPLVSNYALTMDVTCHFKKSLLQSFCHFIYNVYVHKTEQLPRRCKMIKFYAKEMKNLKKLIKHFTISFFYANFSSLGAPIYSNQEAFILRDPEGHDRTKQYETTEYVNSRTGFHFG